VQELDVAGRHLHVDHEVGARERADDVDLLWIEQDRVQLKPAVRLVQDGTTKGSSSWPLTSLPNTYAALLR